MSRRSRDESLSRLTVELGRSLRRLRRELDDGSGRPRPPTLRELLRFTDEVAIPAAILVLETNIRALELLRRAVRIAEGRDPRDERQGQSVGDRAAEVGRTALAQLDDALADVQAALDGRPPDDDARELLDEARALRDELDERLADALDEPAAAGTTTGESQDVPVDVDAELAALKSDLNDADTDDAR